MGSCRLRVEKDIGHTHGMRHVIEMLWVVYETDWGEVGLYCEEVGKKA